MGFFRRKGLHVTVGTASPTAPDFVPSGGSPEPPVEVPLPSDPYRTPGEVRPAPTLAGVMRELTEQAQRELPARWLAANPPHLPVASVLDARRPRRLSGFGPVGLLVELYIRIRLRLRRRPRR